MVKHAQQRLTVDQRSHPLPTYYVRVQVDQEHYFVPGFRESDIERLKGKG